MSDKPARAPSAPRAAPPAPARPAPEPPRGPAPVDLRDPGRWWAAQTRRMAALLLLVLPEQSALRTLAGELGVGPVESLPARIQAQALALQTALGSDNNQPLARLARAHELSPFEIDLFTLAMLPELDDRFGDAFSALRGGPRRPTLGLALRLLVGAETDRMKLWSWLYPRDPWRLGLLIPPEPGLSWADRELAPTPALCAGATGAVPPNLSRGATVQLEQRPDARIEELRPCLEATLDEIQAWIAATGPGAIACEPSSGRELAEALAARVGVPLLRVAGVNDPSALLEAGALSWMLGALPVLELLPDAPSLPLPARWVLPLPAVILASSAARLEVPESLPFRRVTPPAPGPAEQAAAWVRLAGDTRGIDVDLLGNQTRLSTRVMRGAITLARARGAMDTRGVLAALASLSPDPSSPLAITTRPEVPWEDLVLSARTRERLEALRARLLHRATVQDRWGMGGHEGRGDGLIALLHGEPGTGKTLAAEAISTALGLPLMRIDLSRVVSKYIGETEKNLAAAFDAAEGFRAVLFFDEADAMFTRRTAVSDAHDRYANQETNYLLQRLESFEGLTLLATNALQNMDEAFLRRIPFVVPLSRPTRALQRELWSRILPAAQLEPDVNLDELVARHDLVGGEIRSAALGAAYAAASAGSLIGQELLERAVRAELSKRGRPLPESRQRASEPT